MHFRIVPLLTGLFAAIHPAHAQPSAPAGPQDRPVRRNEAMDLAKLIASVQKPPFQQVGVLNLEAFFPEKDRFGLAMALNNIIASPSFAAWLITCLSLHSGNNRPPCRPRPRCPRPGRG
mgnify:CR=1 FL=1